MSARSSYLYKGFSFFFIIFSFIFFTASAVFSDCSNSGIDGPATGVSTLASDYYSGQGTANSGTTSITVGASRLSSRAITAGDLLLVIQMQDASISYTNNSNYGSNLGVGKGYTALNSVGLYEYVIATNNVSTSGGTITIKSPLINTYRTQNATSTKGQSRFQVIRVPQYSTLSLSGTVTGPAWNGSTGGVVAFDVAGNLNFNSATISMNGKGFRGGGARQLGGGSGGSNTDYVSSSNNNFHASKGEGTAGTPRYVYDGSSVIDTGVEGYPGGSFARGAPGNAGGGGSDGNPSANDENSGGGGGANAGAGGTGGNTWSSNLPRGGLGGETFPSTVNRIVMGGGGGAGTRNNSSGSIVSSGGVGGGIVFIRTGSVSNTGTINVNGTTPPDPENDGAGGGGAGGSVLFLSSDNDLSGITINANGAKGANAWPTQSGSSSAHGPGGGGGGGYIAASNGAIINRANGTAGYTTTNTSNYYGAPTSGVGASQLGSITYPIDANSITGSSSNSSCFPSLTVKKITTTPIVTNSITGTTAQYIITVSNSSTQGEARNVAISDSLPSGFTYLSTNSIDLIGGSTRTSTVNPTSGASNPSFGNFTITGGGSVRITFTVSIASSVIAGVYQNPATATYSDPTRTTSGGTLSSNYISSSSTAEDVTVNIPFTATKTSNSSNPAPGETFEYTITLSNSSSINMTNIQISDPIPNNVSYQINTTKLDGLNKTDISDSDEVYYNTSTKTLSVNISSLPSGTTKILKFNVKVDTNAFNVIVTNKATITSPNLLQPYIVTNTLNTTSLFKMYPNNEGSGIAGSIIYYTHEVVSSVSGEVTLSYTSNKNWVYSFYKDINGNSLLDSGDIQINPLGLSLGNIYLENPSHSIKLIVKVSIPSDIPLDTVDILKILGTLDPTDINKPNVTVEVQDITTVTQKTTGVGLKLIKSVSPSGPQPPNTNLTYSIVFTNLGDTSISNLVIRDVVPNSTTYISSSINVPWTGSIIAPSVGNSGEIKWIITGQVAPGQSGTVIFTVKIK